MDLGSFDYTAAAQDVVNAASQGVLAGPIKDYNQFMNRVGAALSPTRRILGNALTRQNVLKRLQQRQDPVFAFDWLGIVLDSGLSTAAQVPWEYIDSITLPSLSVSVKPQFFNGTERKFATGFATDNASIEFYVDRSGLAFNYTNHWVRSTFRQDGFYALPGSYKKDIVVFVLDAKRHIVVDYRLVGCFPTSVNSVELGGNDRVRMQLSLSVDEMFINYDSDLTAAKASIEGMFGSVLGANGTVAGVAASGANAFGRFFGQ